MKLAVLLLCQTFIWQTDAACVAGEYPTGTDTDVCNKCPVGWYGTDGSQCTACADGKSTVNPGSPAANDCLCAKGYKMATDCEKCGANEYKDQVSNGATCSNCAAGTSTNGVTGATSASACVCDAGKYRMSSTATTCTDCEIGYISTVGATSCTKCATGTTTTAAGQIECVCDKGYFGFKATCAVCPKGFYKSVVGSLTDGTATDANTCKKCNAGLTTASTGSVADTDCIKSCSAGQKASQTTCTPCDKGTYQPNGDQKDCISCGGAAYTTSGTGTQQQTDCQCAVGYYGTYNKCTACPKGTYQDTTNQASCKQCANDKVTTAEASKAASACIDKRSGSHSYSVSFKIINLSWSNNYKTESHADYISLKGGLTAALEPVFEGITAGGSVVYYGTGNWDFSEGSIDVKFDTVYSNDDLDSDQIEGAIKNSLSGTNQLAGSTYQVDPDSIGVSENDLKWYVILAIVLGSLVVLALFIVVIVLCVMHFNKEDRRREQGHYGDRDRMMYYDNRSRGRDPGVTNRAGPYPGTGFDDRKETPSMFPNPRKNMWQMKDNGWTPRQYPTDVYGGEGAPYGSSPYYKKPYGQDDHLY